MIIVKACKEEPCTPGVFLHGKMAYISGYDMCLVENRPVKDDIYDCIVECNGKLHESKLFYWHDKMKRRRGLVVKLGDKDAMWDAKVKYKLKEAVI